MTTSEDQILFFANLQTQLDFFHNDFVSAAAASVDFDQKVAADSLSVGGHSYAGITALGSRQAFGGLVWVGTADSPMVFLKEISSDGNIQTVDVLYPFHPILLYFNPTILKLMLDPLYLQQETGLYPNNYSMHDLGAHFPNATGHTAGDDEKMPVEECGNMIIMSLAYAQRLNDTAWLKSHYAKIKQWAVFLVEDSLIPTNQLSTDDFAGKLSNQTNLALKGIIGIRATGEIASMIGETTDAQNYTDIANSYITQWQVLGTVKNATMPHTTLNYGNDTTYSVLYNLWSDLELGLNFVPQSVYEMQSAWYPHVSTKYGVPLDTRHTWAKNDEQILAAATCTQSTMEMFLDNIATWINETVTNRPLTDLYDAISGDYPGTPPNQIFFVARPVTGGYFAPLVAKYAGPAS